jgi:hypothetical protein
MAKTEADPYGMTSKKGNCNNKGNSNNGSSNGNSNGSSNGSSNGNSNGSSNGNGDLQLQRQQLWQLLSLQF